MYHDKKRGYPDAMELQAGAWKGTYPYKEYANTKEGKKKLKAIEEAEKAAGQKQNSGGQPPKEAGGQQPQIGAPPAEGADAGSDGDEDIYTGNALTWPGYDDGDDGADAGTMVPYEG